MHCQFYQLLRSLPNESTVLNGEASSMDLYFETYPSISPHGYKLGQTKRHRFQANIYGLNFFANNNFYTFAQSMIFLFAVQTLMTQTHEKAVTLVDLAQVVRKVQDNTIHRINRSGQRGLFFKNLSSGQRFIPWIALSSLRTTGAWSLLCTLVKSAK